ncbi:MAG: TIGR01177 family methyltransferase, partial [Nanoarchaeota archaeon]|nr:TIGR01177 family methyltransferase [Nanoarchaeota archaeon]
GNDITKKMLEMTKLNLKSFKLRAKLTQKDALQLKETADAVVTDLPYGKGSHSSLETKQLYEKFLQKSYDLLKPGKYLIAVFPRKIKFKSKLKFIKDIEFYMHGSLTRHIILAKKSKK